MKEIQIPYWPEVAHDTDLRTVAGLLDKLEFSKIDTESWPEFAYKPEITFSMAHSGNCIFIKFNVLEKHTQAIYRETNSPVSRDSCVEFFISLDGGNDYYNFEFNCIGTCKAGFGNKTRTDRRYLPNDVIDRINRQSLIKTGHRVHNGLIAWELTVSIPIEVFCHDRIASFKGLKSRANFYKCGENLPEPHFIVWNHVKAEKPDFHLPEFFGNAYFM